MLGLGLSIVKGGGLTSSGTPPGIPQNLVATPGDGLVDLQWDAVDGATGYNIYRDSVKIRTNYGDVDFEDTGLDNGTEYSYAVSAVNTGGESAQSDAATATPSSGGLTALDPVTDLAAVDDGSEELSITWTDPGSVPVHLHLVVTRDTGSGPVEVVNTTLAAGASQPYLVPGIGTYAGTITNIGDGVTTTDSTDATFSGVTVAEASISAFSDLSGLNRLYDANAISGSESDPISVIPDSSTTNDASQTMSGSVRPLLRLNHFLSTKNGLEFDGVDDNAFSGSSVAGGTGSARTLAAVIDLNSVSADYTAINQYGGSDAVWRASSSGRGNWRTLRAAHRNDYPEAVPTNGLLGVLIVSDPTYFELFLNGQSQGRLPASVMSDDYLAIGSTGQGSKFTPMVFGVLAHYAAVHTPAQQKALMHFMRDEYGCTYDETGSNKQSNVWAYDGTINMVGTLAWEEDSIQEICPFQLGDGSLIAVYSGGWTTTSTGFATSTDNGDTWTKSANPILGNGHGGESGNTFRPSLARAANGDIHLHYITPDSGGGDWKKVISTDNGATWGSPILILAKSDVPDAYGDRGWANSGPIYVSGHPTVDDGWYTLIEASTSASYVWKIFTGTSSDGLTWTINSTPVTALQRDPSGMYGGPCVTRIGNRFWVYYHSSLNGLVHTQIYAAYSDDFVTWTQIVNPVFAIADFPFASDFANLDQLGDASVTFLLDGTSAIWLEGVDNDAQKSRVARATLPYQLTS